MSDTVRIAAMADVHHAGSSNGSLQQLLAEIAARADVLLICGDLTHHGEPDEAVSLARDLGRTHLPILCVLGNHDYHSNAQDQIKRVLSDAGIKVLDGDIAEVRGIGFAGVKGFASGFGQRVIEPWGEPIMKAFVREAVEEALKLESALARLAGRPKVALLHYAPISATVEGEPHEIYPFLGSSRLEEPLNRFQVVAAFHGHAHHGQLTGHTSTGVPVYNVSIPLLRASRPDQPPFRVIEVPLVAEAPR